jgi:DNA-binding transcriptional ArsR family regulator
MTNVTVPFPPPQDEEPATPASTREDLLGGQTRRGPAIRSSFVQERGGARVPGPLHHFVRERRLFALQLYLLLSCLARSDPWDTALLAATWARALDKTNNGAESTVSRSWAWLEEQDLVRTERSKRLVRVYRLAEDGSGADYTQSRDFFYFPLAFFRDEWHKELSLPATAVLLIALHKSKHKPWFQLRTEEQSKWYGISPDTLQRGLDELREAKLLHAHPRRVHDSKARYGTTLVNEYILLGAFATPGSEAPAEEPAAS